jgi:hypothetical protein
MWPASVWQTGRATMGVPRRIGVLLVSSGPWGNEIDALRCLWSHMPITLLGLVHRVQVGYRDFFTLGLSKADMVICYLLRTTNDSLVGKLRREL